MSIERFVVLVTYLLILQQSINRVTSTRRHVSTMRRRDDNNLLSDSGHAAATGGEASTSRLDHVVTEDHQLGFKLKVRFVSADCQQRAADSRPSTSGSTTPRKTMTSTDTVTVIQHHQVDWRLQQRLTLTAYNGQHLNELQVLTRSHFVHASFQTVKIRWLSWMKLGSTEVGCHVVTM